MKSSQTLAISRGCSKQYTLQGTMDHFVMCLPSPCYSLLRTIIKLDYKHTVPLVAQAVKNLPAMQETWIQSLDWEGPLEKEMAIHSSILAWRIPWTKECGGQPSMGSQRIRHNLVI